MSRADELADKLDANDWGWTQTRAKAAAELRRLSAVNAELLGALGEIAWSNDSKWQADRARAAIQKAEEA